MTDTDENVHREEWMSDEQWRCAQVASEFKGGFHHITNLRACGKGIAIDEPGEISTFDFNGMTTLTVLAHDRCVRIGASIDRREKQFEDHKYMEHALQISFHPRARSGSANWEIHPELEDHIKTVRSRIGVHNE